MSVYLDFFKNFIDFFNDWPARARFIFKARLITDGVPPEESQVRER